MQCGEWITLAGDDPGARGNSHGANEYGGDGREIADGHGQRGRSRVEDARQDFEEEVSQRSSTGAAEHQSGDRDDAAQALALCSSTSTASKKRFATSSDSRAARRSFYYTMSYAR
jgi:hypothetical protein